jgi:hypothetical protein
VYWGIAVGFTAMVATLLMWISFLSPNAKRLPPALIGQDQ